MSRLLVLLRSFLIAALLLSATTATMSVAAQEATQAVGAVQDQAEDVVEEDDEGFDWGLLGLLGLAGLAGLMRRPQPVVHEDLNRTTTRTGTGINDRDRGGTTI